MPEHNRFKRTDRKGRAPDANRDDRQGPKDDRRPHRDAVPYDEEPQTDPRFAKARHYKGPPDPRRDNNRTGPKPDARTEATDADEGEAPNTKFRGVRPQGWDAVASWYNEHLADADTLHEQVLAPGLISMVAGLVQAKGSRALDVACGQGYFSRYLHSEGWQTTGVDIAPAMVNQARENSPRKIEYVVDNAQILSKIKRQYQLAVCMMAVQNMEEGDKMIKRVSEKLAKGGHFVMTTLHPAFRIPQHSDWLYDEQSRIQKRVVDLYTSHKKIRIKMNPSEARSQYTYTYHRPMAYYLNAFADAGFCIDMVQEWTSHKSSQAGPRARAENTAREEFPMFLAIRGRKL